MTYFKRYFTYRLRATAFRTLIISIIAAVLSNAITSSSGSRTGVDSGFEIIGIFIGIAAVLFPMLETYQLKQRRTLDLVFALPVTKAQLALAHFLSGLCQMLAVSLVTCISTMVAIMAKNADVIKAGNTPLCGGMDNSVFSCCFPRGCLLLFDNDLPLLARQHGWRRLGFHVWRSRRILSYHVLYR